MYGAQINITLEFLRYLEDNYYYNSGCWVSYKTDEAKDRREIVKEFMGLEE
jgi:hypothetical protein